MGNTLCSAAGGDPDTWPPSTSTMSGTSPPRATLPSNPPKPPFLESQPAAQGPKPATSARLLLPPAPARPGRREMGLIFLKTTKANQKKKRPRCFTSLHLLLFM